MLLPLRLLLFTFVAPTTITGVGALSVIDSTVTGVGTSSSEGTGDVIVLDFSATGEGNVTWEAAGGLLVASISVLGEGTVSGEGTPIDTTRENVIRFKLEAIEFRKRR